MPSYDEEYRLTLEDIQLAESRLQKYLAEGNQSAAAECRQIIRELRALLDKIIQRK